MKCDGYRAYRTGGLEWTVRRSQGGWQYTCIGSPGVCVMGRASTRPVLAGRMARDYFRFRRSVAITA
jgi:hypothetical protein